MPGYRGPDGGRAPHRDIGAGDIVKFRKKPIEVEAVSVSELLVAASAPAALTPEWIREAYNRCNVRFLPDAVEIRTLEGTMRADRADWIIQGVQGELYPCKPEIFAATYEAVEA